MYFSKMWTLSLMLAVAGVAYGETSVDAPRPTPLTRPEMKRLIEDVKERKPRIPLPELTAEEKERLDGRSGGYESRLRSHYLRGIEDGRGGNPGGAGGGRPRGEASAPGTRPASGQPAGGQPGGAGRTGGFRQEQEPGMTLDNAFKVELFWIVSRANNCQYCLGHQESKLLNAGLTEDRIAALDSDWSGFNPAEQTAYAFARKFTFQPYLLSDEDIISLRKHYTEMQIIEMILSMAWNNSINRWKEGVGVPQNRGEGGFSRLGRGDPAVAADPNAVKKPSGTYLTPTSPAFEKKVTRVAALVVDAKTGEPTTTTVCDRPRLETREEVEQMLAKCRERTPRLPLVEEAAARTALADKWEAGTPLPNWARLLANFPRSGGSRLASVRSSNEKGDLTPLLKAQLSWIVARQDRAWYALGLAQRRLRELGQTDDQIYALDGDWKEFTQREQSLFVVAKKLGASPVVLTDNEVTHAVELAGPRDVVQAISFTTNLAAFNRITEAAGLPLEK